MEKKERVAWLDYVRFLSIFLVILYHTPPRFSLVDDAILWNLHVPVFFCISGFLYNREKVKTIKNLIVHRGKQLLIPYTTFFIFFYILWIIIGRNLLGNEEKAIDILKPIYEFIGGCPTIIVATYWYIACLFTTQIIYFIIESFFSNNRKLFVFCVVLSIISWYFPNIKYWNFSNGMLLYLPIFAFGNCFKSYLKNISFSSEQKGLKLCTVAFLAMSIMMLLDEYKKYEFYSTVKIFAEMAMIPAYVSFSKLLAGKFGRNRVVEFVVVSGTVYLGLQNYFIGFIKIVLNRALYDGVIDDNAWLRLVIAIVVMAAIYPVAWFIDRYIPWFIGKGKYLDKI